MWVKFIALAFMCNGLLLTSNKMFHEFGGDTSISSFLLVFWGVALSLASLVAIKEKVAFARQELCIGSIVGLCGLFTSVFILWSLKRLPGVVVFPVVCGGNPIVVTLGAYGIFHERLGAKGVLGVVAGCLGIVLLSV